MIKEGAIRVTEFSTNGPLEFDDSPQAKLVFHRERGWSVHISTSGRPAEHIDVTTMKKTGKVSREQTDITAYALRDTETLPYPEKGMILFASGQKVGALDVSSLNNVPVEWDYTIYLEPASLEELRLEIEEPPAYATWRPETTPERDAGPPLEVTARVVSSTGKKPNTQVERFEWELQNTSKEPGVALNFPLKAKDVKFDLELDAAGEHFVLSQENQKMERAVREGWSDTVKVVPFDWGGWSTLQVTAILTDGRRVTGKLKGKSEYGVRIPKRDKDSRIADGWKKSTGASGADKVDDEEIAGQKDNGDGFTLYEEYRGWVENGQHLDGDPKDKDFFVLNLIGGDAEPGIDLFAGVSQLAVHSKLRPEEMSEETRLMNGNHREGAHNKDQHGVWVKTFASKSELGDDGAMTTMNEKGVAGRPGITKGVGILARDNTESAFNKPFNLPAEDAIFAFDRAIAHELLHSVGVEHHGSGDYKKDLFFISEKHPENRLGKPFYATSLKSKEPIRVLDEAGRDLAASDAIAQNIQMFRDSRFSSYLADAKKEYAIAAGYGQQSKFGSPEALAELRFYDDMALTWGNNGALVGVEHGEHSGDQDCLMRYYFAKYYESKEPGEKTLYLATAGTERIGMQICRSGKGTGINDDTHSPQSRYGNTAGESGNCFEQICPNDAIPPRNVK
jgi:hypothetical protein